MPTPSGPNTYSVRPEPLAPPPTTPRTLCERGQVGCGRRTTTRSGPVVEVKGVSHGASRRDSTPKDTSLLGDSRWVVARLWWGRLSRHFCWGPGLYPRSIRSIGSFMSLTGETWELGCQVGGVSTDDE